LTCGHSPRDIFLAGSFLDENAGSGLSENQQTRDISGHLTDRYSERKERAEKQAKIDLAAASGAVG
jgi:hypothetical protein